MSSNLQPTPEDKWELKNKNLQVKECVNFVPLFRQKSGTDFKSYRCHCGEKLRYHAAFLEEGADRDDVINRLVPESIRKECAYKNWETMVPEAETMPDLGNLWKGQFKIKPTNAYGEITFSNTADVEPAKKH